MNPEFNIIAFFHYFYEKMSIIITSPFLLFERHVRRHVTLLVYDNTQNWKMTKLSPIYTKLVQMDLSLDYVL